MNELALQGKTLLQGKICGNGKHKKKEQKETLALSTKHLEMIYRRSVARRSGERDGLIDTLILRIYFFHVFWYFVHFFLFGGIFERPLIISNRRVLLYGFCSYGFKPFWIKVSGVFMSRSERVIRGTAAGSQRAVIVLACCQLLLIKKIYIFSQTPVTSRSCE